MAITVSTASRRVGNWQVADGHRLRDAVQAQLDLGDDAQRAFGADEQPRQVVAGGGFAHPPAGADHPAVGQRHGQAHDVLPHRAVAHRVGAGGAGRAHAADGAGRGAWIDREEQAQITQMLFSCFPRDAGLDAAIHVGLADLEDAGHPRQVQRDAAAHRRDMALERGAGAQGHHRNMRAAWHSASNRAASSERFDERDRIRHDRRLGVLAVRVVLAQRGIGGDAIAEEVPGGGDDGCDRHGSSLTRVPASIGPGCRAWQVILPPAAATEQAARSGPECCSIVMAGRVPAI